MRKNNKTNRSCEDKWAVDEVNASKWDFVNGSYSIFRKYGQNFIANFKHLSDIMP